MPPPTLPEIQAFMETFARKGPPGGPPGWPGGNPYLQRLEGALEDLFQAVIRLEKMAYFDVPRANTGGPVLASWPNNPANPPDKSPPPPAPMVPPA